MSSEADGARGATAAELIPPDLGLLLRDLLPAAAALDGALPALPRLLAHLLGEVRLEARRARRVDLVQRLGLRDVPPEEVERGAGEDGRAECGGPAGAYSQDSAARGMTKKGGKRK